MHSNCSSKNTTPKISVIMGVFNGEKFLGEAVDSILGQTYEDFEFIICNDCSKDGSMEILRKYEKLDSRIVLLENERNLGLAATLNKCLHIARGQWIARMDCDDRSLPNRFECQLAWLESHPEVCALGCAVEYIDDSGAIFGRSHMDQDQYFRLKDAVKCSALVHPSVMMRKTDVIAVGGYSVNSLTTRAEDYDLWCKLCENGAILANTAQILFQYREDESNIVKRKYQYRIQEARLKWHWICRAKSSVIQLVYAVKPLLVGLIPLGIYKKMHRKNLTTKNK